MKKITALISPLHHRGEEQIKVIIPNDLAAKSLIKQIFGRKWSATHSCWYIPKTVEAYRQLKELFDVKNKIISHIEKKVEQSEIAKTAVQDFFIKIEPEHHFRIKVWIPWQCKDWIEKIKSLPNRAWNKEEKYWSVPKTIETLAQLKLLFGEGLQVSEEIQWNIEESLVRPLIKEKMAENANAELPLARVESSAPNSKESQNSIKSPPLNVKFATYKRHGETIKAVVGNQIIIDKDNEKWLRTFVPQDKKWWVEVVKNIIGRKWDKMEKCWLLPNVKESYRFLKQNIGMENLSFCFEISADIPEVYALYKAPSKRKTKNENFEKLSNFQKGEILKVVEKLTVKRYSIWTIKSYKSHLAGLFVFYKKSDPKEITKKQLEQYILHLIRFKKISESTQNQIISAVKAYWEQALGRGKEWIEIERPKKSKRLPSILSTEEVVTLLKASENLKHKLALLLIYSAGLRKSELLNLLRSDVNIKRRAIHIKNGKGKKDRYVTLAETAVPYLEKYLKMFRPVRWLFEGQSGGQYSGSSLQQIFTKALEKSKINPHATIHTLRHCYATHCIEQGHHIKQVQDALGHNSIKTTEIYLHISSDALKKLRSPLDNIELK